MNSRRTDREDRPRHYVDIVGVPGSKPGAPTNQDNGLAANYEGATGSREPVAFWRRVRIGEPDQCWPWVGYRLPSGYGRIWWDKRQTAAHRLAYRIAVGPIPDGLLIRHKCDNRACCNPAHLEPGTHADNTNDALVRGRLPRGPTHGRTKLTCEAVEAIKQNPDGRSGHALAQRYGVTRSLVCHIRRGRRRAEK